MLVSFRLTPSNNSVDSPPDFGFLFDIDKCLFTSFLSFIQLIFVVFFPLTTWSKLPGLPVHEYFA